MQTPVPVLLSVSHYCIFVLLQNAGGLCAPASFQHLCENVSKGQSESMSKNLSVPICFVCLLHLANEKVSNLPSVCVSMYKYEVSLSLFLPLRLCLFLDKKTWQT